MWYRGCQRRQDVRLGHEPPERARGSGRNARRRVGQHVAAAAADMLPAMLLRACGCTLLLASDWQTAGSAGGTSSAAAAASDRADSARAVRRELSSRVRLAQRRAASRSAAARTLALSSSVARRASTTSQSVWRAQPRL